MCKSVHNETDCIPGAIYIEAATKRTPKKQFNGELKYSEIEYSRIHGGKYSKLSVTSRGEDQTKSKLCKPGPDHVCVKTFSTLLHYKQLFSLFTNVLLLFKAHCQYKSLL